MLRVLILSICASLWGFSAQSQSEMDKFISDPVQLIKEAKESFALAKKENNTSQKAKAAYTICEQFLSSNNYLETLTFCLDAVQYYEPNNSNDTTAVLYDNIGILYDITGDMSSSKSAFEKGLVFAEKANEPSIKGTLLNDLGVLFAHEDEDTKALELYYQAREIFEQENDYNGLKRVYVSIGRTFEKQSNYEKAISFYEKSLAASERIKDQLWTAIALNYLGNVYLTTRDWAKAGRRFESVIALSEQTNNLYSKAMAQISLAKIAMNNKDYDIASNRLNDALQILNTTQKEQNKDEAFNLLGEINIQTKNYKQAKIFLDSALVLGTKYNSKRSLSKTYSLFGQVHALLDDKDQAIYAYQRSEILKDSIFLSEKANWAEQSEASYNLGKKDAEINSLEQSAMLKESDLQQQRAFNVALVVIVILGTILTITVIQNLKQQRKRKEELERRVKEQTLDLLNATNKLKQSYYELERFAFIASHDFKEPVRNIGTFISLIQRKLEKQEDTELRDYLHYCKESAKRLHNLMEDATAFLRLSDRKVAKQEIELNSIIQRTWEKLDAQHAKLCIEAESQSIKGYEEDIEILLKQLIENGLKYNRSKQPHISIQIESQATSNIIRIQDNGVGIEDRHKEKVMGMFTRAFHEYEGKGSGLGLAICKKIMDLHNGKISLESEVGKGTTVYLSFPN